MARQRPAEQLSTEELRRLLVERHRAERQTRLEHYRRTGRVVKLESEPGTTPIDALRTDEGETPPDSARQAPEEVLNAAPARRKRRTWVDSLLFLIEVGAVIGLVFVLFNGFSVLRTLNKEVSSAIQLPTLTPTPLITAFILPGGHTPPNAPGGVQPNDAEIPEHLRPLVQALASLPVPTASPEQAVRIQIPAIGVDAPIVQGDGWEQLKKGVGQLVGSPNPGKEGNLVMSAHNDVFGEIFRDLDQLKPGDQIILFTNQRTFTYTVRQTQVVEPTRVDVLAPSTDPIVTLISCYPYMVDKQRIVITGTLETQN